MVTHLSRSSYPVLLNKIREALSRGRERARVAVEKEKAATYWEVGRFINEDLRIHDGRAGYGERLIPRLALDLDVSDRLLWKIVLVQTLFKIPPTRGRNLEWSHYVILSGIEDPKQRNLFYQKALRRGLSVRELIDELRKHSIRLSQEGKAVSKLTGPGVILPRLKPRRGALYTYRIVKPRDLHDRPDFYSIDLGFKIRIDFRLTRLKGLKEGTVIEAIRTEEHPRGDRYRFRKSEAGREGLYTCKAQIQEVIDADTMWASVDLGFRVWTEQKLRLRGINAREMGDGGKKAAAYVKKALAQVPFVVVKLGTRDKFDRYLTDLFYLPGATDPREVLAKGRFLNQELVDRGLAELI